MHCVHFCMGFRTGKIFPQRSTLSSLFWQAQCCATMLCVLSMLCTTTGRSPVQHCQGTSGVLERPCTVGGGGTPPPTPPDPPPMFEAESQILHRHLWRQEDLSLKISWSEFGGDQRGTLGGGGPSQAPLLSPFRPPPFYYIRIGHPPPPPAQGQMHYLWFAFVCFLIRSHPRPRANGVVLVRTW